MNKIYCVTFCIHACMGSLLSTNITYDQPWDRSIDHRLTKIFNILIRFIHWKGNQAKIYIRPVQTILDTTPNDQREVFSDAKVSCKTCHCLLSVRELRNHVNICVVGKCERVDELQDMDSEGSEYTINVNIDVNE